MIIQEWECSAPTPLAPCTPEKPGHFDRPESKRRQNLYFCGGVFVAIRCDGEGCTKEVPIEYHHARDYNLIRLSSREGWFFRQDETLAYCFDHLPMEVIAWRDRKGTGWRKKLRKGLAGKLPSIEEAERVARVSAARYNGSSRSKPTYPRRPR